MHKDTPSRLRLHSYARYWKPHPLRNFQESTCEALFDTTAEHSTAIPGKGMVDRHHAVVPRMPRVTDFSRFSTMGVALSTCPRRPNASGTCERDSHPSNRSEALTSRRQRGVVTPTGRTASPLHRGGLRHRRIGHNPSRSARTFMSQLCELSVEPSARF